MSEDFQSRRLHEVVQDLETEASIYIINEQSKPTYMTKLYDDSQSIR